MVTVFDIFAKPEARGTNQSITISALQLGISVKALLALLSYNGLVSYEDVNAKNNALRICANRFMIENKYADMYISAGKGSVTGKAKRFSQTVITQSGISYIRKNFKNEISRFRKMSKSGETIEQIVNS